MSRSRAPATPTARPPWRRARRSPSCVRPRSATSCAPTRWSGSATAGSVSTTSPSGGPTAMWSPSSADRAPCSLHLGDSSEEPMDSTLRRMVWVFPDRESSRAVPRWQRAFWNAYEEVAAQLGLEWTSHPPEDVVVDGMTPGQAAVYVAGERVTPADTLFVTSLYSLPYQAMDVFNQ